MPKKKDAASKTSKPKRGDKPLKKTSEVSKQSTASAKSAKKKDTAPKAATVQKAAKSNVSETSPRAARGRASRVQEQGGAATGQAVAKSGQKATRKGADRLAAAVVERQMLPEEQIPSSVPTEVREHFFHEHHAPETGLPTRELPEEYNETRLVLLVRDPEWIFCYWEVQDATRQELRIPRNGHNRRMVVRMYKINGRRWPEEAAHYFFDVDISPYASNWYVRVPEPDARWCAELGVFDEEGNYICIARSNAVSTPRDTMSEETDSEWMVVEETYRKLYGLSGGYALRELRASEEILRHLQKQVYPALRGEETSSGALVGASRAAVTPPVAEADFWLQVHTELVLYGATEPNANVTVQGQPVRLRPDGTFSLRYALPDGEQVLSVRGTSADGQFERSITPVVKKTTK